MERSILICDWCMGGKRTARPDGLAFAVSTLVLQNGKPKTKSPSLDLCAPHVRELERLFRPRAKVGRPRKSLQVLREESPTERRKRLDRERHAAQRGQKGPGPRAKQWAAKWADAEQKVLAALKGKPEGLKGPDLVEASGVSKSAIYKVLPKLMDAEKVARVAEGGRQGYRLAGAASGS